MSVFTGTGVKIHVEDKGRKAQNHSPTRTAKELGEEFGLSSHVAARILKLAGVEPCIRLNGAKGMGYYPYQQAKAVLKDRKK